MKKPDPKDRRSSPRVATVVQVKYKRRQDFVLEYARDISLGGVNIASEDPLAEGEAVDVHLHLPGLAQPVVLPGKVVRTVRSRTSGLSGMGIAFDEVDEYTHATLMGYLKEIELQRECIIDRRGKMVRFDHVVEVNYTSVREFLVDYSENLSKNGMFIRTENPSATDSIVPMKIKLPNGQSLEITAKVCHVMAIEKARKLNRPPGMGVEFIHFHGDSRERLWTYVEELSKNLP